MPRRKHFAAPPERPHIDLCSLRFVDDDIVDPIMGIIRKRIAPNFGVTIIGPYMTLRFYDGDNFVQASFICTNLTHDAHLEEPEEEAQ